MDLIQISVPTDFSAASVAQLQQVQADAAKAVQPILAKMKNGGPGILTEAEAAALREMSAHNVAATSELAKRQAHHDEIAAAAASFSAVAEEDKPAEETTASTETTAAEENKGTQTAATKAAPRASDLAATATTDVSSVTAASQQPVFGGWHYAEGSGLKEFTNMRQLGKAITDKAGSYPARPTGGGSDLIAEFRRDYPAALRGPSETAEEHEFGLMLDAQKSYADMVSGNQTAAAAYCSPSLTLYDLCELETADGILPTTEMQISRGGIFFTTGPDFASIFNGSGYWNYTEAQVIANTVKPCMEIPCPPFTELRLRNLGVCITAGILQRRGYPELIARFIRGAMIAHLHRINAFVIAQMAAGSTLVDFDPIPGGSLVGDNTATGLLAAAEMVGTDMRYRNRLAIDAQLETVFPAWVIPQLRADVSRRTGVDMISVSDADIVSWFTDRKLTLRLVYSWQDAYSGVAAGPGAAAPGITTFPGTVEFMIYPAGTWVKGVDDTIRLETVYDSVKLGTNQYTALFTEEGVLVAQVCPDSRRVVYPLCPTGATTAPVERSCVSA